MSSQEINIIISFWSLVIISLLFPGSIIFYLTRKQSRNRYAILFCGIALVILAGVDMLILQRLGVLAKATSMKWDDPIFSSELSIALYVLPLTCAGIGIDIISYVITCHFQMMEMEKKDNPKT